MVPGTPKEWDSVTRAVQVLGTPKVSHKAGKMYLWFHLPSSCKYVVSSESGRNDAESW